MATSVNEPYYYILPKWYKGNMPAFYDSSQFELTRILETHADEIIKEITDFYKNHSSKLSPGFVPYKKVNRAGWNTLSIYSLRSINKKMLPYFPETWMLLKDYPGLSTIIIVVMNPGVRLKAHFGDSDAMIRNHFGVVIPEPYPKIGIRVKTEERGWETGKVISFNDAHRHYAWNFSDKPRIILMVDIIKPELRHRKIEIESKILAAAAMKLVVARFPSTKKIPVLLLPPAHRILAFAARIYLLLFK